MLVVEVFEIRGGTHFFEVSMDGMNPDNFLRAIGWPQMGAKK